MFSWKTPTCEQVGLGDLQLCNFTGLHRHCANKPVSAHLEFWSPIRALLLPEITLDAMPRKHQPCLVVKRGYMFATSISLDRNRNCLRLKAERDKSSVEPKLVDNSDIGKRVQDCAIVLQTFVQLRPQKRFRQNLLRVKPLQRQISSPDVLTTNGRLLHNFAPTCCNIKPHPISKWSCLEATTELVCPISAEQTAYFPVSPKRI